MVYRVKGELLREVNHAAVGVRIGVGRRGRRGVVAVVQVLWSTGGIVMAEWSVEGLECPFATRKTREAVGWVLTRPVEWEAVRVHCGDWCQLFDKNVQDCRLVTQRRED